MSVTEFRSPTTADQGQPPPATAPFVNCEQCRAPLDAHQRYCVVCGLHRREVADPAARYLSQASARARTAARIAQARASGRGAQRRVVGFGTAALIALIPAAGIAGYAIGDSGSGGGSTATRSHTHVATGGSGSGGGGSSSTKSSSGSGGQTGSSYVQSQNSSPSSVSVP